MCLRSQFWCLLCCNLKQQGLTPCTCHHFIFASVATESYASYKELELNAYVPVSLKAGDGALTQENRSFWNFWAFSGCVYCVFVACLSSSVTFWSKQLLVFIYFWVSGNSPERSCSTAVLLSEWDAATGGTACTQECVNKMWVLHGGDGIFI